LTPIIPVIFSPHWRPALAVPKSEGVLSLIAKTMRLHRRFVRVPELLEHLPRAVGEGFGVPIQTCLIDQKRALGQPAHQRQPARPPPPPPGTTGQADSRWRLVPLPPRPFPATAFRLPPGPQPADLLRGGPPPRLAPTSAVGRVPSASSAESPAQRPARRHPL